MQTQPLRIAIWGCDMAGFNASGGNMPGFTPAPAAPSEVWRRYDLPELDRQYDARASVASFEAEYARYVAASAPMLAHPNRVADLVYDPQSGEKLDLYLAGPDSPLFVWIHGGYWRASSRLDNAFAAAGMLARGVSGAVIDYTLAPAVGLDEIVRQTRAAIGWLYRQAGHYGYDARKIHIGGSSAGGQLVGMVLAPGWQSAQGLPDTGIGAALALSGLHDVEPLLHTKVNTWLKADLAIAQRNSPIRHLPRGGGAHLLASVGGLESAEFKRQTADYAAAFAQAGNAVTTLDMPAFHHFDIALSLDQSDGALCKALAARIAKIRKENA